MAKKIKEEPKQDVVITKEEPKQETGLVSANLGSATLATLAGYDASMFEGVGLDVSDNKDLFSNDVLIPKIWLVQGQSEVFLEKKADTGDFVDSKSLDIIAPAGQTLKFVVLKVFKRWQTFKMVLDEKKKKMVKEFVSSEIIILDKNEKLPYQETIDGVDHIRRQVISAYVLLERDVMKNINKPYIIDFASSSKGAGRVIVSDIATVNNMNLPSFVLYFEMISKLEKFDEGSAFVKVAKVGGYLPKDMMPFLKDAYFKIPNIENQMEIDDSDIIKDKNTVEVEADVSKKVDAVSSDI